MTGGLQIRNSRESDEGKYECVAENSAGVTYSYAANLYVRGKYYDLVLSVYILYSVQELVGSPL